MTNQVASPSGEPPPAIASHQAVILQQPYATAMQPGASQPQSPAHQSQQQASSGTSGGGAGESDSDVPRRVEFVDSTIKTLDEKLRTLLYQEPPPCQPSSTAPDPQAGKGELLVRINPFVCLIQICASRYLGA